jgi:hypothetical protein
MKSTHGKTTALFCALLLALSLLGGGCGGDGDPCRDVDCGAHGSCDAGSGACVCDTGYSGAACDACATGYHAEGDACAADLEIAGAWVDDWGTSHDIAQDSWTMGDDVFHISQLDNEADFLVAQNDAANAYNPDLWSRFDWTWHEDQLYYCQIAYDAADEATAAGNQDADRSDLETGCAGFAWSLLTPR